MKDNILIWNSLYHETQFTGKAVDNSELENEANKEDEMDEYSKTVIGQAICNILRLKEDRSENFNPKRYRTAWGNKTALGIYETVKRLIEK
jgi:hypothetical protein